MARLRYWFHTARVWGWHWMHCTFARLDSFSVRRMMEAQNEQFYADVDMWGEEEEE